MRHAAVDIMSAQNFAADRKIEVKPEIARATHLQGDRFALEFRSNHPGRSLERNSFERPRRSTREAREATCAVAAHFGFAAVGVVITHPEIGPVRGRLKHEDAVRPDSAMAIAEASDLRAAEREVTGTIV